MASVALARYATHITHKTVKNAYNIYYFSGNFSRHRQPKKKHAFTRKNTRKTLPMWPDVYKVSPMNH